MQIIDVYIFETEILKMNVFIFYFILLWIKLREALFKIVVTNKYIVNSKSLNPQYSSSSYFI